MPAGAAKSGQGPSVAPKRLRVGLFGPYSSKNLGDTATQMAVMENLRQRCPGVEFIGICADPFDAARTHRIPATDMEGSTSRLVTWEEPAASGGRSIKGAMARLLPARLLRYIPGVLVEIVERLVGLFNITRTAGRIDLLLVSGGGQVDDFWGGPWRRPYELLVWTLACRCRGRKVAAFGTGLDNLTTRTGAWLAFGAMRLAHYRMFRDRETLDVLRKAGVVQPSSVAPDPAFSLAVDPEWGRDRSRGGTRVALVCPIAETAWLRGTSESYLKYLDVLIECCVRLLRAGLEVQLSNSQTVMDAPVVEAVAARVRDRMGADSGSPRVRLAATVSEYCSIASNADLVIASRLHGVMLPIITGTPVVAVSYIRKVSALMTDAGMEERCLQLSALTKDRLTVLAFDTLANGSAVREQIRDLNARFRAALAAEYDALVRTAGASAPLR